MADRRSSDTTLVPPKLPPFLATVFDLQPIAGAPKAEDVRLVHEAIRTINTLLHTPELRDSDLPMELSQYLFEIQMICYRERYPVGVFPNDIEYTPPTLPAHIPIKLEPVVGPPSDAELRSAHTALRISDSFTNAPSLFDPDLSMQLSQHVFDLQLARHIQRSTRIQLSESRSMPQSHNFTPIVPHGSDPTGESHSMNDMDRSTQRGADHLQGRSTAADDLSDIQRLGTTQRGGPSVADGHDKNNPQEFIKVQVEIREALRDIQRVLVSSQNSLARALNYSHHTGAAYVIGAHSVINDKGETPEMHGLPTVKGAWSLNAEAIARYLRFYDIGGEMIEGDEEPRIKPGMEEEAKRLLTKRLCISR